MFHAKTKGLRTGFTTGACATAAVRAACLALKTGVGVEVVEIRLPGGQESPFPISSCLIEQNRARCSVVKDAGDDPDVTHGAEVIAEVSLINTPGLHLKGGKGVGTVTRPGLGLEVGSPAINPVPRQMIISSVKEVFGELPADKGLEIIISVPGGEKLARRTLNPRLGITGGISILGTTGIVIPYSLEAYTACITQSLQVARACGINEVVLTSGRQSENYARRNLSFPEEAYIQMGDQLAFTLEECARTGFSTVHLWAMMGKLSKIAAGHLSTHYTKSSVEMDFLLNLAGKTGLQEKELADLRTASTAHDFLERAKGRNSWRFFNELCCLAANSCSRHVNGAFSISCVLVDYEGQALGKCLIQLHNG